MSRLVGLRNLEDVDGPAREMAESGLAQYGQLLETWRALLNCPDIFATYLPFLRAVAGPGQLDQRVKDLTALRVAVLNNCRYTISHRAASARKNGILEVDIIAVGLGDWASLSPVERWALQFTDELTLKPAATAWTDMSQIVSEPLLAKLKSALHDEELVELTLSISLWNGLARFHRVMGFELDMPAPPERLDPAR
jgi:AhpD family alkylhydroperoxidase